MDVTVKVHVKRSGQGAKKTAEVVRTNSNAAADRYTKNIQLFSKKMAAVDTGHLRDSIDREQLGPGHSRVTVGAFYGVYVNYGTRHMAAQPFWEPAIRDARAIFDEDMKKVWQA